MLKMFGEDPKKFIAQTNGDIFAIKIDGINESPNYFLSDEEVEELRTLCEYHLRNKKMSE